MATARLIVDEPAEGWQEAVDPSRINELLGEPGNVVWLDIADPGPTELELLRREFGFHELALEDVASGEQRPKCDTYGDHYFIVVYAAEHAARDCWPRELHLFWGENYLVTTHQGPLEVIDETRRRWERQENRRERGAGLLVYTLFDSLVDAYFPLLDWVAERVEDIEDEIFARAGNRVLTDLFRLRKDLLYMRRVLAPTRDVVNVVLRRDLPLYPESLMPYFSDVYDHAIRVLDGMDTYRDLMASALDLHLSAQSNRLNQTVKRMTALTLVVMVPTLIAGIYGMNFEGSFFPPADWDLAFPATLAMMGALIGGGIALFRYLDWL